MNSRPPACGAWELLIQLLLSQRGQLPVLAATLELSPAQCHVLYAIEPGKPMPMKQLAASLSCDASNVTGLVDRLESRGLLRRVADTNDRRVKVLDLTPNGAKLRAELVARMSTPPAAIGRLSPRDQRELERILSRLLE
jgi:DNA-binding MarR family transcriptional regulator